MREIFCLFALIISINLFAQEVNIIPKPVEMKIGKGIFIINKQTVIAFNDQTVKAADFLKFYLKKNYGLELQTTMHNRENKKAILLWHGGEQERKGFYKLECDKNGIIIGGNSDGIFYGIQTLIQLLPTTNQKLQTKKQQLSIPQLSIPQLSITDYPRFQYRGMHLDCGRHFFSVDFIKQYIDYLALHKLNKFHWHLTDDQGWRIEIKKYPKLTSVGGWRNGTIIGRYPGTGNDGLKYGGYYTQEQIKEIVKYAADRYIDVIPEIEMPGHASAAIAAYPELSCFPNEPTINFFPKQCKWSGDSTGKQVQQTWGVFDDVFCAGQEKTFTFLQDVMDEVLALFPSKYIHVGGDESPKENWKSCPNCQKRIKDEHLKDEHELQSYFIQRLEKYLNNKGRTLVGWDEILEGGLAPKAVVMSWRGEQGGIDAAKQNHDVIMTPNNPVYFDYTQSENEDSVTIGGYNPIEKVYAYEPIPAALNEEQGKHVLGAQANVWTEYMKNTKKLEYMIFPRMAALSEVLWSKRENWDWKDFEKRLMGQFKRYDLWKANYSKAYFDLKATVMRGTEVPLIKWKLESKIPTGKILIKIEGADHGMGNFRDYYEPLHIGGIVGGWGTPMVAMLYDTVLKKGLSEIRQGFTFNKATGKKISLKTEPSKSYPGDGAFTLVNGVQNKKGFARSREFIGFSGEDCEAIIDLGKTETISAAIVHSLRRTSSWIWRPLTVEVQISTDGTNYTFAGLTDDFITDTDSKENGTMKVRFDAKQARFIKIIIKCWDDIPAGEPGAGNKPWLFVDEIEVE
jgi:hexosaminidase